MLPDEAAEILFKRRRMRESLIGFAQNIVIPNAPNDEDSDILAPVETGLASHHILLMNELQRCMTTRYGRLMVFMPPGAAKSTYCTVVAPTWDMGNHPGTQIILASYNTTLAKKQGARARSIIEQPIYNATFDSRLKKGSTSKEEWACTNGSEYMSGGILSGITGNRARGMVIDDPIRGRKDADSPIIRADTVAAYEDDLKTRYIPGAWVVLVQTRWHDEDLAGSLLPEDYAGQSGDILCRDGLIWHVINLPAKAEYDDDPLGREKGEYLWPEWFDAQHWSLYEPRKGDPNSPNERTWSALYQQRPRPVTGNMFNKPDYHRYELGQHPKHLNFYASSDYGTQDGSGDLTEHGIAGLDENGDLWIVDWYFNQVSTDVGVAALLMLALKWQVRKGFGEKGIIRHAIEPLFKDAQKKSKWKMQIEYLPSAGKKTEKAMAYQGLVSSGRVHIPDCPWGDHVVDQSCDFPGRSRDDAVDVMALFGRALLNIRWSKVLVPKKRKPEAEFGTWEWLIQGTNHKEERKYKVF